MSNFKRDNYIQVPGFAIVDLKLSGNELLCYSLIYGFTQDEETEFNGSLNYVASALNVTKQNAKRVLDRLVEKELIEKRELFFSGVKFCKYVAIMPSYQNDYSGIKTATGGIKTATGVVSKQQRPNNNSSKSYIDSKDNILNNIDNNIPQGGLKQSPSKNSDVYETTLPTTFVRGEEKEEEKGKEEEKARRAKRTVEPLCLFADSRYYDFDLFVKEFDLPEFQEVDLSYYYHAVADWSSQKGKKMKDWIATARNFMRSDKDKNKLHTIYKGLPQDAVDYLQSMMPEEWRR